MTKFTVVYEAIYKYTCKDFSERTGKPYHQKNEVAFHSNYYYLGERIDDCMRNFWAFILQHGYTRRMDQDEKTYEKYIVIKEVQREEKPDDYSCGHCNCIDDGRLVVTQITSDMIIHMWSLTAGKYVSILCPEPHKMPAYKAYIPEHFGKGMEQLKIGDIVEYTCEKHSLISGIYYFYNPTGENNMEAAKKMHQYAIEAESSGLFDYPGKYTRDCFNVLERKGIKPVVVDAFSVMK